MSITISISPNKSIYTSGETINIKAVCDKVFNTKMDVCYKTNNSDPVWLGQQYTENTTDCYNYDLKVPSFSNTEKSTIYFYCCRNIKVDNDVPLDLTDNDRQESLDSYYASIVVQPNNTAPIISGTDENLGNKSSNFIQSFTVNDINTNDTLTVAVKLDDIQINNFTATRNVNYQIDLSSRWNTLSDGVHKLVINCSDGTDSTTRTYTFNKVSNGESSGGSDSGNTGITINGDIFEFPTKKLDLKRDKDIVINCKQLDDIILSFDVYDNGKKVDISDYSVQLIGGIGNNLVITSKGINKSGNNVKVQCPRQLTFVPGEVLSEFKFTKNGKQKRSFNVTINVQKCVEGSVESGIIVSVLNDLDNAINKADSLNTDLIKNIINGNELNNNLLNNVNIASPINRSLKENIPFAQELVNKITDKNSDINKHINNSDIHVTKEQKEKWDHYSEMIINLASIIDKYIFDNANVVDDDGNNVIDDYGNTVIL